MDMETEMASGPEEMGADTGNQPDMHSEMRVYEIGFHVDGELPQEEAKKSYDALKDLITKHGTVVAEGELEKIELAYTISRMETTGRRDFTTAYFGWIVYEADGTGHNAVNDAARADLHLVRFIDLRTTKEAAKHAAEMHEFYRRAPHTEEEVAEEAADAELDAALKEVGL
jgi:ribosomal protein S6